MPVNKVVFGDRTLIDLTSDTVSADKLAKGVTAHDKTGVQITGTMESGGSSEKYGATVDTFLGDVDASGVLQAPTAQTDLVFDGVTDVPSDILLQKFKGFKGIKSVHFPDLVKVSGNQAIKQAFYLTNVQSVSFPSLIELTGGDCMNYCFFRIPASTVSFPVLKRITGRGAMSSAFSGSSITSASFPELEIVVNQGLYSCFSGCPNLTNVSFPKLKTIGNPDGGGYDDGQFFEAFYKTGVTTLEFPELTAIYCTGTSNYSSGTFKGNSTVTKMYFPKLSIIATMISSATAGINNIFSGCNSLTEIHFGAANQAAIEATEGYPTLWGRGAGNATVYFDL